MAPLGDSAPHGYHRIVQRTLRASRGQLLPRSALAALLRYAAAAEDTGGETIAVLVGRLADACAVGHGEGLRSLDATRYGVINYNAFKANDINTYSNGGRYMERANGIGEEGGTECLMRSGLQAYEVALRSTFAASLPVHIAPLVRAVLSRRPLRAETVQLCLHHVAAVVRGRHTGALRAETVLGAFHACALSALRWLLHEGANCGRMHGDLCIQVMSCLKHAPLFVLCDAYAALSSHGYVTPSVQCKFLANCGLVAGTCLPPSCAGLVVQVFGALARGARGDVRAVEEGLVHGSAALLAARRADIVRAAYTNIPALRETPHSVIAHARGGNVGATLRALSRLAQTRAEGWLNVPVPVLRAAHGCCALVGRRGGAAGDVAALHAALAAFRNPGLRLAQGIEFVLAGLADLAAGGEWRSCAGHFQQSSDHSHANGSGDAAARAAVDAVCPTLRACLAHIGDDFNADGILALIEACVTARHVAVPLTAAVVWAIQRAQGLAMRDLCARIDASTNGVSFPAYYALCYARDCGCAETVERLAALWHCDARPVLRREAHLAPMCKLWRCAACGRQNSDRFNYCLCSALRHGIVLCARCGYDQDERWAQCQSCGATLRGNVLDPALHTRGPPPRHEAGTEKNGDTRAIAAAVLRRAWTCDACGAANPARQTRHCFRCAAATGPVARAAARLPATSSSPHAHAHCHGKCESAKREGARRAGTSEAPYCRACGSFREAHAAAVSNVWRCVCCGARLSALDRACPSCAHVECTPSAQLPRDAVLACLACRRQPSHPFAADCEHCGGRVDLIDEACDANAVDAAADTAVLCARCGDVSLRGASLCATCGESLSDAESLRVAARHCGACGKSVPLLYVAAHCPHCDAFVSPLRDEGWSAPVLCATAAAVLRVSDAAPSRAAALLSAIVRAVAVDAQDTCVAESRVTVTAWLSRIDAAAMGRVGTDDGSARRVVALSRQWMEQADHRASVCVATAATRFAPGECRHCLGSHRAELCVYAPDPSWTCGACGAANENADVCRYVCRECLELRPCVRAECPSEAWECPRCERANVDFERYCSFCGVHREAAESAMETAAEVFPFFPAKCKTCSLVYLEARCPICSNDVPKEMREADGVVCLVTCRYAFIQPVGTEHPNQRVFVAEPWLRKRRWSEGEKVVFTAELNERGGGFRVVDVRS